MNVLLYAPALLLVYLTVLGLPHTFVQLSICAGVQVSSLVLLKVLNSHFSGGACFALPCLPPSQLCCRSFQPWQSFSLPMDGQLALSTRGNLPCSMVSSAFDGSSLGNPILLHQKLAAAAGILCQAEKGPSALLLPTSGLALVHVKLHWCDVCQKSPLPVLCLVLSLSTLPGLDYPIPSEDKASHTGCDWALLEHVSIHPVVKPRPSRKSLFATWRSPGPHRPKVILPVVC